MTRSRTRAEMRTRATLAVALVMPLLLSSSVGAQQNTAPVLAELELAIATDRPSYVVGELVELRYRLAPRSGPALAPARMSVEDGSLALFVRRGAGEFLEYRGPGWGMKRTSRLSTVRLTPPQAVEAVGTVLYNRVPEVHHLSPMYAKAQLAGRIPTEYAFAEPGTYMLKGVYRSAYSDERLESNPIEITVTEPTGQDAAVWQRLRRDPRLGYLLQTGVLPGDATNAEEDAAVAVLEDIVRSRPSTVYADRARQQLAHFQAFLRHERRDPPAARSTGEPR